MRLLVVGGCGAVGSMVLPGLVESHEVRVLDLRAPERPVQGVEYHQGDVHDVGSTAALLDGVDSLVYMAMGPMGDWGSPRNAAQHLDVAVTGLYLALSAAHGAGVTHAVYTSSQSVHRYLTPDGRLGDRHELGRYPDETATPDARDFYGLAKRLGEEVCRNAAAEWAMDTVCLRLCHPTPDDQWPRTSPLVQALIGTSARDTCAALLAALRYRGHGFDAFAISGDAAGRTMSLAKARDLLGWQPRDHNPVPVTASGGAP